MSTKKKLLQAAAGSAGGAGLNVEEVFSTYLYTGDNGSNRDITNGIDLSTEGGMVWWRPRDNTDGWGLIDTERGAGKNLRTHGTFSEYTDNGLISAFNTDGYRIGGPGGSYINSSSNNYVSFSFRKAPKFFDVVTYTGNGTAGRTVSHNLGSVPGCIIIKRTDTTGSWRSYHTSLGATKYIDINSTSAAGTSNNNWADTEPTSTEITLGSSVNVNASGGTYVAYLFAHNDGDGEFGSTADQDIIKCGSYAGNSTIGHTINLGFEAQWVLVRSTSNLRKWMLYDVMRGMPVDGNGAALYPNSTDAEEALPRIGASNVGFQLTSTDSMVNLSGETYIYIAIRRGPMAVPESATDVFDISHAVNTIDTSWPVDLAITTQMSGDSNYVRDRLRGSTTANRTPYLKTDATSAEADGGIFGFDDMTGLGISGWGTGYVHWLWRRAPNYFDVVAYTGTGSAMTLNHNLGVTPEMIWTKRRDSIGSWIVYHSATGLNKYLFLNSTAAVGSAGNYYAVSDTTFGAPFVNSGGTFISYLFASLDGVSKVGSYTGDGTTGRVIDCGFSSGARFVMVRTYTQADNWWIFDTERGIVAGNDPRLYLNTTDAEATTADLVDPHSSGFIVNNVNGEMNFSGRGYIFYAIA